MMVDGRSLLALRYSVWTLVNVKRLALLAPKHIFPGACRLPRFCIQLCDSLEFTAAVGFFRIVRWNIAHRLAWSFGFHVVDSPLDMGRIRGILSPFQLAAQDVEVVLVGRGNQLHRHVGPHDSQEIASLKLKAHLPIDSGMDLFFPR